MRLFNKLEISTLTTVLLLTGLTLSAYAQPSPSALASQFEEASERYLANIERVVITIERDIIGEETFAYYKETVDGRAVLRSEGDEHEDPIGLAEFNSPQFYMFLNGASSITSETLDGTSVYKIYVDDPEVFEAMEMEFDFEEDMDDEDFGEPKSATAWIGQDDMLLRKIEFEVESDGNIMKVIMTMSDFETFDGLPVPMKSVIEVDGWQDMISDEEMEEGMRAMEELKRELENMPEAQRDMIMEQMAPQIEQFEAMLEGGMASAMESRVTRVEVNP